MDIEIVMKRLYQSEIDCSIATFWDNGWDVKPGDEMNGFKAEGNFQTLDEAAAFLDYEARKHCGESLHALGKLEHERRQAIRLEQERAMDASQKERTRCLHLYRWTDAGLKDIKTWCKHLGRSHLRSFTDDQGHLSLEKNADRERSGQSSRDRVTK